MAKDHQSFSSINQTSHTTVTYLPHCLVDSVTLLSVSESGADEIQTQGDGHYSLVPVYAQLFDKLSLSMSVRPCLFNISLRNTTQQKGQILVRNVRGTLAAR